MKLISMTDFALKECGKCGNEPRLLRIEKYAKFLKQPLTLWMFTPCDEYGNVLEEPNNYNDWLKDGHRSVKFTVSDNVICENFKKAKGKVLFDGFAIIQGEGSASLTKFLVYDNEDIGFKKEWKDDWEFEFNAIERLCELDLELTESAIKQLGL